MEIQILKRYETDKLKELISVFEHAFEMENFRHTTVKHLQHLLNKDIFFAVVAIIENRIVGGLTAYVHDQYYSEKPLAYIFDLAVFSEYQSKGVGSNLIDFTNNYCRQMGFEEVFVQADKIDTYAIDFYRSTKPTEEEQVVHFYYTLSSNN